MTMGSAVGEVVVAEKVFVMTRPDTDTLPVPTGMSGIADSFATTLVSKVVCDALSVLSTASKSLLILWSEGAAMTTSTLTEPALSVAVTRSLATPAVSATASTMLVFILSLFELDRAL